MKISYSNNTITFSLYYNYNVLISSLSKTDDFISYLQNGFYIGLSSGTIRYPVKWVYEKFIFCRKYKKDFYFSGTKGTYTININDYFSQQIIIANTNDPKYLELPFIVADSLITVNALSDSTIKNPGFIGSIYYDNEILQRKIINTSGGWYYNLNSVKVISEKNINNSSFGFNKIPNVDDNASWIWGFSGNNIQYTELSYRVKDTADIKNRTCPLFFN